jgi:hypothetical protein
MNRLLIGILDVLNKLLALFIVISSTVSGYLGNFQQYLGGYQGAGVRVFTTIVGFVLGVIAAALVSGLLAAVININRELEAIRQILLTERRP